MKKILLLTSFILFTTVSCMKAKTCITQYNWEFSAQNRSIASAIPDYSYGGIKLDQVLKSEPCHSKRVKIEIPLTHPEKEIVAKDMFVGVSDKGDVGIIHGKTESRPPMFVAFICTDKPASALHGTLKDVSYSGFSKCLFKPVNHARMVFNDKSEVVFRKLDHHGTKAYCL